LRRTEQNRPTLIVSKINLCLQVEWGRLSVIQQIAYKLLNEIGTISMSYDLIQV